MTTRPTVSPLFATAATFSAGTEVGLVPRLDPGAGFRAQGWYPNRRVPARWFNFLLGLAGDWIAYLTQKTDHYQNVLNHGANPLGTTDSTAAFAAADAAASSTGGFVWAPPGSYRHDDTLHPSAGVSWIGVPDSTYLNINHATKDQLLFDVGGSRKNITEIRGISFGALVNNTGNAVSIPSGVTRRGIFRDCTWNDPGSGGSPLLKGRKALIQGSGSVLAFERCWLSAVGTAAAMLLSATNSELHLNDTRLIMPATYTGPLLEIDDGVLHAHDNVFDVTAHSGSADIIELLALGCHVLKDNTFLGAFSSGACIKTLSGGIKISETGSVFDTVNAYSLAGSLALGSELSLQNPIASTIGGAGTITCATGYRGQSLRCTNNFGGVGPLIVMSPELFVDQRFTLTLHNDSLVPWSGVTFSGVVVPTTVSITNGFVRTLQFRAMDANADGTPHWVIEHDPSSQYAAA